MPFILLLALVLPLAWLASEFTQSRSARIGLGCAALVTSFGIATLVGQLERLEANAYYGAATKDLVQNTIRQLEADNADRVLRELHHLRSRFDPSYESRADYDQLVSQYVQRVSDRPIIHDPGSPEWLE